MPRSATSRSFLVALLFCLEALLIPATIATNAITLQVEPQTEECFYVHNAAGVQDSYSVVFTVTRGGKLDIYLQVRVLFR